MNAIFPIQVLSLLAVCIRFAPIEEGKRIFKDICLLPYQLGVDLTINFTYFTDFSETKILEMFLTNEDYSHELFYYRSLGLSNTFTSQVILPKTLVKGLFMHIDFSARGENYFVEQDLNIYQNTTQDVHLSGFDHIQTYESPKNIATLDSNGVTIYLCERFEFINFTSEVIDDYYLRFDLTKFSFNFKSLFSKTPIIENETLKILDVENDFPLLIREVPNKVRLDLDAFSINGNFGLFLKNNLYIDPVNRLSSHSEKQGFIPTSFLYFPPDRFESLRSISATIQFNLKGANTYLIDYSFQYLSQNKYFGGCFDSKYCLTTSTNGMEIGNEVVRTIING